MITLGIDIGTTTISTAILDEEKELECCTVKNDSQLESCSHMQNADRIVEIVKEICANYAKKYCIEGIGVTGQMHGVLYVDANGNAVSPLYTWQNPYGNLHYGDGTYCDYINKVTGYNTASGFGLVTHFYFEKTGKVHSQASKICTIGDYAAMKLCSRNEPAIHVSNAASLGLFDLNKNRFDEKALDLLNINPDILPRVCGNCIEIGRYSDKIRVMSAIGDNQASFLGSVDDVQNQMLLNLGTGGQISCYSKYPVKSNLFETRPLDNGSFILVYSSLCGGKAYALLEKFFRSVLDMSGVDSKPLYEAMERCAIHNSSSEVLDVNTCFCGTRDNPELRGSIGNISFDNFTPEFMIVGFLSGMTEEMYPAYLDFMKIRNFKSIVASGNAIRNNSVLRKIISDRFDIPIIFAQRSEEAACGAAMCAKKQP